MALLDPAAVELGERFKLPANLNILPYKSQIVKLTDDTWRAQGPNWQNDLLRTLNQKLDWYRSLIEDRREGRDQESPVWKQLAANDTNSDSRDDVCLVPLYMLP